MAYDGGWDARRVDVTIISDLACCFSLQQLIASIEIQGAAAQCLFYSKNALEDELQYEDETVKIMATYPPLGVVGAICPWNFPVCCPSFSSSISCRQF